MGGRGKGARGVGRGGRPAAQAARPHSRGPSLALPPRPHPPPAPRLQLGDELPHIVQPRQHVLAIQQQGDDGGVRGRGSRPPRRRVPGQKLAGAGKEVARAGGVDAAGLGGLHHRGGGISRGRACRVGRERKGAESDTRPVPRRPVQASRVLEQTPVRPCLDPLPCSPPSRPPTHRAPGIRRTGTPAWRPRWPCRPRSNKNTRSASCAGRAPFEGGEGLVRVKRRGEEGGRTRCG